MKNILQFAHLLAFMLLLTSCFHEKEIEVVLPNQQAQLIRTINYSYDQPQSSSINSYGGDLVRINASNDVDGLMLGFGVQENIGPDRVSLKFLKDKLKNGYVGIYSLKSLPDPDTGDIEVSYSYRREENAYTLISSNFATMQGNVIITDYDAKNKLISGTYEVNLINTSDPTVSQLNQTNIKRCDIILKGSFTNIRVN